jgi:uncharacterized protein VirK/YbjX
MAENAPTESPVTIAEPDGPLAEYPNLSDGVPVEILFGTLVLLLTGLAAVAMNRAFALPASSSGVLARLYHLGRESHPAWTAKDFKRRAIILGLWLTSRRELRDWYGISDNPGLAAALKQFPLMHGAIYGPYINHAWPMGRRLKTIEQHYRLLGGRAAIIGAAAREPTVLATLEQHCAGLRLVLDKTEWFLREGEVVLNLFAGEQRLLSAAFTLGSEGAQRVAYVGALQGAHMENALQIYRDLTRALHQMRPRDLLLVALRQLCREMGVARIYAVTSEARQHNSPFFGDSHKQKVLLNYDEVWSDQGGSRLDNGFFEIPVPVKHREAGEIPSRKRASYRRRYQMLDTLAQDIAAACSRYESAQPDPGRPL